ncbi:hypothetical protein [Deinococcus planocerae]|uniref:hypothetical protein n=1 Tax=Deinococcus planocerae TaxID=1737569 RepID=UPI000C7F2E04|nr:hypothetical protein [Deinococcus planocerae]
MTPPLSIRDIAQPDTTTQFVSDVQLSTFYDNAAFNRDLMQRFMFTRGTGGHTERKGTADLLRLLHQSVTAIGATGDNRFVFMATYGHGKSHLGLALANYFGAPRGSQELETVLHKLEHALPQDEAQVFRDFRANEAKAPFLVLILRGDRPGSLRDAFFQALDRALSGHGGEQTFQPPFWFDKADELLERLGKNPTDAVTANAFLTGHGRDLPSLRQEIGERRSGAYQLAVGAFRAVHGIEPNLGGETALNDAVEWIVKDLCGPGKPFGGLLILFDEFSRFVQDYGQNNPVGAPLQELLSGVGHASARGKALFVGLSQHDPVVIANRYGGGEELIKELNRIPEPNRHRMQTMLEDVLGGVLKTNDAAWQQFMGDPRVGITVSEASDTARLLFADRYGPKQLSWDLKTILNKVAKQCFPLHPLTTAFLSSVTLHSSGTVRSVLGFLQDERGDVMPRFREPALTQSGQPNWVLPTRLVDYFGEALGEDKYKNFKNVIKPDLTGEQQEVLKAMLLLDVAELPTKQAGGYAAVIANLTGLEEGQAGRTLRTLEEQHYIRYDSANKTYSFNIGSSGAQDLDRLLNETIAKREEDKKLAQLFEQFSGGTNPVNSLNLGKPYPVDISWGHPDDWAAKEVMVPVSALKQDLLTALRNKYAVPIDSPPEARGVVVLVVPKTQKEADEAVEKIKHLLSQSEKDHAAPLLFLVPREAHAELHTNLLKLALLNEALFKNTARPKVGESALGELEQSLSSKVTKGLDGLRTGSVMVAPPAMQQALDARLRPGMANRVGEALKVVYDLAYPHHPDSFFTQYKQSTVNLTRATVDVIYELLDNSLDQVKWSAGAKVPGEVVKLLQKDWKIVSLQQQVMEPEFTRVKTAWDRVEGTFSPRIRSAYADKVLLELLQPPYGYDQNTLALLFAAWIGRNRDAIAISGVGKLSRPAPGAKEAFKNPGMFLKAMSGVQIHRKDIAGEKAKVGEVLAQLKGGSFTAAEVKRGINTLQEFKDNNPRYDADYLEQIDGAIAKLQLGLDKQAAYDKTADTFEARLSQARTVTQIKPLADNLKTGFPGLSVVQSDKPTIEQLQERLLKHAASLTAAEIKQHTQLQDISQYSLRAAALKSLSDALYQLGLPELKAQADAALQTLAGARQALEASQAEAAELKLVSNISVKGNLAALRDSLDALRTLELKSDRAYALSEEKYSQLKQAIAGLEGRLPSWETALETVLDAGAAGKLGKELVAGSSLYEGTEEAERLAELQNRADALTRYFGGLSSAPSLHEPADVEHRRAALEALRQEHQGVLNAEQCAQLDVALTKLEQQHQNLEDKATEWLRQQQQQFSSGNTKGLEQALDMAPRFLNEVGRTALSDLRSALRSQLDAVAQEEQQLKLLASLPQSGSLTTLQGSLEELGNLPLLSGKVSEAAMKKRGAIEAELARLGSLPQTWQAQAADATDLRAVEGLAKEVTRHEAAFAGSPQQEVLGSLARQLGDLIRVLRRAGDLRVSPSTRLRELLERQAEQEQLLDEPVLSARQRGVLEQDVARTCQLFGEQVGKLEQELEGYDTKLSAALTVGDLEKLDFSRVPRAGLPESLARQLEDLEGRRHELRRGLSDAAALGKATWRNSSEAQEVLREYGAMLTLPLWSERQREQLEAQGNALRTKVQAKHGEAAAWLTEREQKLPTLTGKGLAQLEGELAQPHPFLDGSEEDRLTALRHSLQARLEEDQALQIETLFEKIESPQRRTALLQRLQSLLLAETP